MAVTPYNVELRGKGSTNFSSDGVIYYPKTLAKNIYAADETTSIFDANQRIKVQYMPSEVFDNLHYTSSLSASGISNLLKAVSLAQYDAGMTSRSMQGLYFVASESITLSQNTTATSGVFSPGGTVWSTNTFIWDDAGGSGASPTSITIEPNDWVVINSISGLGTEASPYAVTWGVVSATYELVTTSAAGLMSASDKTKLDGIASGANNYSHPAYTTRSVDTTGVDVLDTFSSDATGHVTGIGTRTLPNATTGAAGVMSAADKTKLDGIAASADAYGSWNLKVGGVQKLAVGSGVAVDIVGGSNITATYAANVVTIANTYSYTHPSYTIHDIDTTGVDVLSTFNTDTTGHVTGITKRTLPSASASAVGVIELATSAEAQTGSDTTRALTPSAGKDGAKWWSLTPFFASISAADTGAASLEVGKFAIVAYTPA